MKENVIQMVNEQIKAEMFSSYLYLSMAAYLENQNLKGFANWMRVQAKEEYDHALGFFNYLLMRGAKVELLEIAKPENTFINVSDIFAKTLNHENNITAKINNIYELAMQEKDFALHSFLKWYIDEQVEEEANVKELIDKIKILGDNGEALYLLDRELLARQYIPATILGAK